MSLFTPVTGLVGGALIGGSAGLLMVVNGDVMGISGILTNSLGRPLQSLRDPRSQWRWVWLASFSVAVNTYIHYLTPERALSDDRSSSGAAPIPSIAGHVLGGLLVGIGARLQNGCTTGHGICGISRFSLRSLVATCTFTATSILTRYVIAPIRSWSSSTDFLRTDHIPVSSPLASAAVTGVLALLAMTRPVGSTSAVDSSKSLGAALSGIMFAMGLAFSGMTKNSKVHDFLCFSNIAKAIHDPTLATVMISGIASSWLSYQFVKGYSSFPKLEQDSPVGLPMEARFCVPTNTAIDSRLLIGSVLFGMGWGITGICPGPGLYAAAAGAVEAIFAWVPSFLVGAFVGEKIVNEIWEKKKKSA